MTTAELTIGRLARAAEVNIETIRYYQRRRLLPVPNAKRSAFRTYPVTLVERIRFIKRAQELGFSLAEIGDLLKLEDGTQRHAVRRIANARLQEIGKRITDLQRMEHALKHLVKACETSGEARCCPIIDALSGGHSAHDTRKHPNQR